MVWGGGRHVGVGGCADDLFVLLYLDAYAYERELRPKLRFFLLSTTLLRYSMAPSRDLAPLVGTNALITIRRGHELIHVYDTDFAERVLFPHDYPFGPGPVSADHHKFHRGSYYRFERDG